MARGRNISDAKDFAPGALRRMARAADDLRLLLDREYAMAESLKLVGDHFRLTKRQRQFLYRCVSPPQSASRRRAKLLSVDDLAGATLLVDGYNCLIITECIIAGGVVLLSDDGVLRDVEGIFGSFRVSSHTTRALELIVNVLSKAHLAEVNVYLDEKMRYARRVSEQWDRESTRVGLSWRLIPVENADKALQEGDSGAIVATSDRENMDAATRVFDLPRGVADSDPSLGFVDIVKIVSDTG